MKMPALRTLFTLGLMVFALARCDCDTGPLNKVSPKLQVHGVDDATPSICDEPGYNTNCAHSFGDVPLNEGRSLTMMLKNPSPVATTITEITIEQDGTQYTFDGELPELIPAGGSVPLTVRYVPGFAQEASATVWIRSDSVDEPEVQLTFSGVGIDNGRPEISVSPTACDFGQVGVGVTAFCDITIENVGNRDLVIESVAFSPETPAQPNVPANDAVFGASTIIAIGSFVAPGTGLSVRLWAKPNANDTFSGALILGTNDNQNTMVNIPMTVQGASAPTAIAEVDTINGVPNSQSSPQVQPLDDVVLTGVNSVAGTMGATITGYQWELVSKPNESSVSLTAPTSMRTQFQFNNSGRNVTGLDVAGTFTVRLTVTDSNGAVSSNEATVTLNAVPTEALHVQLTWDTPTGDLDLHIAHNGGAWCSAQSCYYGNCKATSTGRPDWDGNGNSSSPGDPVLDIDDLSGFGPENTNIDSPQSSSTYRVGVSFYSRSAPAAYATLKLYVNGALRAEWTERLSARDFWNVADVDWRTSPPTVTPLLYMGGSGSCLN